MKGVVISMLAVLAMVYFMARPSSAISCEQVAEDLAASVPFLNIGQSTGPSTSMLQWREENQGELSKP
ncbi:hypothetical protein CJ030_MR0G006341 [Morella rubra]|uniref:Uncharacterized protein n=1 Tax=Morella rubra TaxID=262757 RepID=A0A6A1ULH0_9ROSI|nr:hypothetical protein CJ030_MR0G006330 [Morella rubra]KAB1200798.1 hypothetical protein CJ030_MR0G006340 [Morella rubra]KAB1200799.1 hypothetical protein CJ030_MR0G006341 [Morella rubra]